MVHLVVTNQDPPLVPSQKFLGLPQLFHVIPCELGYYRIFNHLLQVGGYLVWDLDHS